MIIVAGIGTNVGKTVVSAIVATQMKADYWKPIECGESDTDRIQKLLNPQEHTIYSPIYSFPQPLSPHQAAQDSGSSIERFTQPTNNRPLVIETAGGILTPLSNSLTNLDLFESWNGSWILVVRHYLGSINHTLLTVTVLKQRGIQLLGLIFNGHANRASEDVIIQISQVPCLGRIPHIPSITKKTIKHHATHTLAPIYTNANSSSSNSHC